MAYHNLNPPMHHHPCTDPCTAMLAHHHIPNPTPPDIYILGLQDTAACSTAEVLHEECKGQQYRFDIFGLEQKFLLPKNIINKFCTYSKNIEDSELNI